jgi:hypothetical protein
LKHTNYFVKTYNLVCVCSKKLTLVYLFDRNFSLTDWCNYEPDSPSAPMRREYTPNMIFLSPLLAGTILAKARKSQAQKRTANISDLFSSYWMTPNSVATKSHTQKESH